MATPRLNPGSVSGPTRLSEGPSRLGGISAPTRLFDTRGGERYPQTDPHRIDEGGAGLGEAIVGELVKSYGWKRDDQTGKWDWELSNIGEAFVDSPVWTTIDWLTLALPYAKLGTAAFSISRGAAKVSSVGQAYKAGELSLKAAAKLHVKAGSPASGMSRLFSNPITAQADDPQMAEFVARHGASPAEVRGYADVAKREMNIEREALRRLSEDAIRAQGKVEPGQHRAMGGLLEAGASPRGGFVQSLGADAAKAYEKTYEYRNALHEQAFKTGLIGEETYTKNLKKYMPRMYEEYVVANPRLGKGAAAGGRQSFLPRTADDHPELTRIWDQSVAIHKMAAAADVVATQGYAQKLAQSVVAKNGDELMEYIERYADNPEMRKVLGITDDALLQFTEARQAGGLGSAEIQSAIFGNMGWRKFGDLFKSANLPDYMKHIPDELKEKYIDPAAAKDVLGVFEGFGGSGSSNGFGAQLNAMYQRSLSLFRASKTAYNPATHVRNYFGGVIFHHLATGGVPKFVPNKGLKALREQGAEYTEAVKAGVLGSSFDVEVRNVLRKAFEKTGDLAKLSKLEAGQGTAIDFMGNSTVAQFLQKGAGASERFYRGIDEVWKLDAFIEMKKKLGKGGMLTGDELTARATLEVNKYMPQFSGHSPIGDVMRKGIPFASFTTEALRVWKNAMQNKPHVAFAWQHFAESASYGIGAANGYSMEEIDSFREMSPDYTHNKKMMMLPFKVDDRPAFLDMSYLIPMGNMAEMEESENAFFALVDPTQNPFIGGVAAAATGKDPFTGRELAPRMLENQVGVTIDQPQLRKLVGLGEHMASTMAPPWLPVGGSSFAAMNFLELARGQRHPITGELLEPNIAATIAANLFGMRTEEASVASQLLNAKRRETKIGDKMKIWRDVAAKSRVNGDVVKMNAALDEMRVLREELEPGTSDKYIKSFLKGTAPGEYRGVGGRQLRESYANSIRLKGLGSLSEQDKRVMTELSARIREKRGSSRSRSRGSRQR